MDKMVAVAVDPVKDRLKVLRTKLKGAGVPGKKLTAQEIEDALADILSHLETN